MTGWTKTKDAPGLKGLKFKASRRGRDMEIETPLGLTLELDDLLLLQDTEVFWMEGKQRKAAVILTSETDEDYGPEDDPADDESRMYVYFIEIGRRSLALSIEYFRQGKGGGCNIQFGLAEAYFEGREAARYFVRKRSLKLIQDISKRGRRIR